MKNPSSPYLRAFAALLLTAALSAHAADKPKKVKYAAPDGFGGQLWEALRTSPGFAQLPETPIGVGAAWMRPVQTDLKFTCITIGGYAVVEDGGDPGKCEPMATLNSMRAKFEGGGLYVLSEYTVDDQGARFGSEKNGVYLHPVIYQFCANWNGVKLDVPQEFDEMNKFCGVRMLFRSETREELRKLPGGHVTTYDRVLEKLIARFGKPDKFTRSGQVIIETMEGDTTDHRERKFGIWRWCPPRDRSIRTRCPASITLALDPATGDGTVMFSTPLLWEYAYARQHHGFKGDPLYRMLHARR